jgi:hypothetical protein
MAWSTVTLVAMMAAGSAIWFMYLQFFVLHGICLYCMAAHLIGLTILGLVLFSRPLLIRALGKLAGVAALGVTVLVAGQVMYEPPITVETYADDAGGASEGETLIISPVEEEAEVMEFALPEEVMPETETDDDEDSPEQTADTPDAGSSKMQPTPDESEVDFISSKRASQSPQPSLSPLPASQQDDADVETNAEADENGSDKREASEDAAETTRRMVTVLGGRARLSIKGRPILGSPNAKYILVELFDYTCKHCRGLHQHLETVRERYGDQIAVLPMVVPLNTDCNSVIRTTSYHHRNACELARYSLAVWRRKPEQYAAYHDWLFEPSGAQSPDKARARAIAIIGQETLEKELDGTAIDIFLRQHAGLYQRAGKGPIPKLMGAKFTIPGQVYSADSLARQLEQYLALPR